uniref:Uracil-DNA glycosylase-like domain-containing protein n=1 Tax=viral metagenome TaxID=1070528 RepID=A0A6C0LR22_9ZZZZ
MTKEHMEFINGIEKQLEVLPDSYRFLYSKLSTIDEKYWFIGLNPRGDISSPKDLYQLEGNEYLNKRWNKSGTGYNNLQKQVFFFFETLCKSLNITDWQSFMSNKWLISNSIFYQTDSSKSIKDSYKRISEDIWKQMIIRNVPKVIVCFSSYDNMKKIFIRLGWQNIIEKETCIGNNKTLISAMKKDNNLCLFVGFCHLSYGKYSIKSTESSKQKLKNICNVIAKCITTNQSQ